jgi:hypothetical protein
MAGVIRSSVSGQVLVLNAGSHTGLYYSTGLLPSDQVVEWTTLPSFDEPIPSRVGSVVTVDPGVVSPEGAVVNAEIGTGSTDETFTAYITGATGTIPSGMAGAEMTARFKVQYTPENPQSPDFPLPPVNYPSLTIIRRSGVTISGTEPVGFPTALTSGQWTAEEVRDVAPAGRRRILVASTVSVPTGYQLALFSGALPASTEPGPTGAILTPGTAYTTNSSLNVGATCNNRVWWKRISDGAFGNPSDTKSFTILGLEDDPGDPDYPDPPTSFPAANQTLTAATQSAIVNAMNARKATGATSRWIIDIPPGNYGNLSLAGLAMPGETIIRSQGLNYGAKFTGININLATNIRFQFVSIDRSSLTRTVGNDGFANGTGFSMMGSTNSGIEYSNIDGGPIIRRPGHAAAWLEHSRWGINADKVSESQRTTNARIYMNAIHGGWLYGIRFGANTDTLIAENVFAEICGDDIQMGTGTRIDIINNWFSRVKYVVVSTSGAVFHCDWLQFDAQFEPGAKFCNILGNVGMKQDWPWEGTISQGIFSSKSKTEDNTYDDNITLGNAVQGVWSEVSGYPGAYASGHVVTNNTSIKLADGRVSNNHQVARVSVEGNATNARNIHSNGAGAGTSGINIPTSNDNRGGGEAYYTSCKVGASFYDFRPIAGQPTHWNYSGTKVGAWSRFQDVIENGKYPRIGAAAALWKQWYDPRDQINFAG